MLEFIHTAGSFNIHQTPSLPFRSCSLQARTEEVGNSTLGQTLTAVGFE